MPLLFKNIEKGKEISWYKSSNEQTIVNPLPKGEPSGVGDLIPYEIEDLSMPFGGHYKLLSHASMKNNNIYLDILGANIIKEGLNKLEDYMGYTLENIKFGIRLVSINKHNI